MKLVSIIILTLSSAGSALAASNTTWVASNGTNNPTCSRTTPCATFAQALAATSPNGVIKAVDAGEFGAGSFVGIAQNVTIDGNGTGAEIDPGTFTAVAIVNAGGQVTIRDLTIRVPPGGYGVQISGGDLHLENVLIVGTPDLGVFANGTTNPTHVTTKNVTITNAGSAGIYLDGASGSFRDSVIRGSANGIYVASFSGHAAAALVERCELSYNGTGLVADNTNAAGATVRVSDTVITANTTGISTIAGGQIITFRTNMLAGNSTDGSTPFSISLK
jgi:hypothetical protein